MRLRSGSNETTRVIGILQNTQEILDDLDRQFCEQTGLNGTDIAILFLAIGLQIARQYLLTKFPIRLDDQVAAQTTFGHLEEHSNRHHRLYNPSLEEIISNPVPFDANVKANGALSGGGYMGHRVTAIGHDPLLGLIFGTANIAITKDFHKLDLGGLAVTIYRLITDRKFIRQVKEEFIFGSYKDMISAY